ncbi:MAG: hypothetical protein ACRD21_11720, partial [Vicinamibacteria bacterium]
MYDASGRLTTRTFTNGVASNYVYSETRGWIVPVAPSVLGATSGLTTLGIGQAAATAAARNAL